MALPAPPPAPPTVQYIPYPVNMAALTMPGMPGTAGVPTQAPVSTQQKHHCCNASCSTGQKTARRRDGHSPSSRGRTVY